VALSLNKLKRLEDAGLTELFDADRKLWTAMTKDAYMYTRKFVGVEVRPDDVSAVSRWSRSTTPRTAARPTGASRI